MEGVARKRRAERSERGVVLEATALFATLAVALALFMRLQLGNARREMLRLEADVEAAQDALWEAQERAERARADGAAALAEAEARAEAGGRAKTRFLTTITHEMRTPLSGVIGTTDLLLDTALAPEQRTYARAVRQSAEAMLSLVDEILDLSRIDAGRVTLQDAPYAVSELVEGVGELLAPRAHAKQLDLAIHVARDMPAELVGDAARVRQILLNLAGNAIKFTRKGGVGVRAEAVDGMARFSVADTGPGFDPAEAPRLFMEFERSDADPAAGGVGLGLAISRRLAEAMGGRLDVEAAPGAGAIFTFALPLRPAAGRPAAGGGERPLAGRGVVVVSASPFSGPWLVESLKEWGAAAELVGPDADLSALPISADTALIDRAGAAPAADLAGAARRAGVARALLLLSPSERRELSTLSADGFDGYLVKPVRAASLISRLDDPRADPAGPRAAPPPVTFPAAGGLRILLAEDDPVSALIAMAHISRLGHSSLHVADGESACAAFEAEAFDAALLDLRMPSIDGCAAARRIRATEAAAGRRPALLLAVTANVAAEDRDAALGAGMDGLLAKPLDRKALESLLAPLAEAAAKVA